VVAFGSDSPVDTFDPFKGIHAAVTRQRADGSPGEQGWYPDARLTFDEGVARLYPRPSLHRRHGKSTRQTCPGFLLIWWFWIAILMLFRLPNFWM